MITKEQQQAIEETALSVARNSNISYSSEGLHGVLAGMKQVIENPAKYGLMSASTKETLMDKQATINEHNELLGNLLAELWKGTKTETITDMIQEFINLKRIGE